MVNDVLDHGRLNMACLLICSLVVPMRIESTQLQSKSTSSKIVDLLNKVSLVRVLGNH